MAQLITTLEVLTYSPAGVGFPNRPISENLDMVEEEIRNGCLGPDLFDYLVTKLSPVDTVPEWQACGDYAQDEIISRNGMQYKSTADHNDTDPLDNGSDWSPIQKFTDTCCNNLWIKYLRKILTYRVYYYALPFATITSGAGGLTVQGIDNRGERAATPTEIGRAQTDVERVISQTTTNMLAWLRNKDQATCGFPSLLSEACATCETQTTNSRFLW